jgi:hypothetical protein
MTPLSRFHAGCLCVALLVGSGTTVRAQIAEQDAPEFGVQLGDSETVLYRVGSEITASRGACRNIVAMVAIPLECPEQSVTIVNEDFSSHVDDVRYRDLADGGARQMLISIRHLPAGAVARAVITCEVSTRIVLPPAETAELKIPARPGRELRPFTIGSPYIEVRHARTRAAAKDALADIPDDATDWQRVEAIYDYVLEKVRYVEGPDKSAVDALRDEFADCQGRGALFIALCRASKIPARMVWVDGHAYPEFFLEHAEGEGSWYPCESSGTRAFGEMPLARTILQKGDNFRVPERPKERLRYASDFMIGVPTPGGGRPKVRYIRELVQE